MPKKTTKTSTKTTSKRRTSQKKGPPLLLRTAAEIESMLKKLEDTSTTELEPTLEKLEEISMADIRRLKKIVPLITESPAIDGDEDSSELTAPREACVEALFPGDDKKFRSFTSRVNRDAGGQLVLQALKNSEGKRVGFATPDDTRERIADYSKAASGLDQHVVDTPALPSDPKARTPLFYSVLHSEGEAKEAQALIDALRSQMRASQRFAHDLWDQRQILTGQLHDGALRDALDRSDYVIALLSPAFLAAPELEEARAAAHSRPCIPVALAQIDDDHHDLGPLAGTEIFRGERSSWTQCSGKQQKESFALDLFKEIERVVVTAHAGEDDLCARVHHSMRREAHLDREHTLDSHVSLTDLQSRVSETKRPAKPQSGRKMLLDWVDDEDAPPYACVLGEFGIGKTTLLKSFTHDLLDRHGDDPSAPLPIFLDLRAHVEAIEGAKKGEAGLPELTVFLGELLRRTWKHVGPPPEPAQVLRLVRDEGAIMVIDGLDEKLVHLSESQGAELIRMLWGILPPEEARDRKKGRRPGRIVLSCRSHIFPTLQKQNATFTGRHRDDVRPSDYLGLIVLPFDEAKIRDYLRGHLGDRVDDAMRLIASIHNLSDLAPRPLFLNLIRQQIASLEAAAARGEPVRGVSLYDHLVESSSDRDDGKHTIRPEDKPVFMEAIAAAMWREGSREWPWPKLFRWLREHIVGDPVLAATYPLGDEHTARIAEDFRTATMVLRPDQGDGFRFAHTSLQEYFLARWLHRALVEGCPQDWALPMPSDETLDFLGQLIELRGDERWRASLEGLLEEHRPQASRAALRYWLLAAAENLHPQPLPRTVSMPGEEFDDWEFVGPEGSRLFLRGADLSGASLRRAEFRNVDLSGANLSNVEATCAVFQGVTLDGAQVDDANMTGVILRDCSAVPLRGETAKWWDSEWIRTIAPSKFTTPGAARLPPPRERSSLWLRLGHVGAVWACEFSPDGRSILSASLDGTLKLWDTASGRSILSLDAHTKTVIACAFSPDGRSILSASLDGTLKLWDATSGRPILSLEAHMGFIGACAFSPDGRTILSASDDGTLKLWDAASGRPILSLEAHTGPVTACAFSPDGCSILSASDDGTLKLWDTASGRSILSLEARTTWVMACAFSPDGCSVLSASDNGTLKLWDATSGRSILSLEAHTGPVTVCVSFSPDGRSILSASSDGTPKLWDAASGRPILSLEGHSKAVIACTFSPDGRSILSASSDGTLKLWDAASGRPILSLDAHTDRVWACAFSPDGRSILSASDDGTPKLWDATSGRPILSLDAHTRPVIACAFSPDGRSILSASLDGTLKLGDATSGHPILSLDAHKNWVTACAFSPDGRSILSASDDGTLKLWDAVSGRPILSLDAHKGLVTACAFSPDGRSILSASSDGTLKLWDAASGRPIASLEGHTDRVWACAFSSDGRSILSASDDGTLKLWDATSGHPILSLAGHTDSVRACAFSSDGRSILSASDDGTLKLWDAASGRPILSLEGHTTWVRACAFSPDGRSILSASSDGTLKLWDASSGTLNRTVLIAGDESAGIDEVASRVLWATPGAWRHLSLRTFDLDRGAYRLYPVEAYGPLPTCPYPRSSSVEPDAESMT